MLSQIKTAYRYTDRAKQDIEHVDNITESGQFTANLSAVKAFLLLFLEKDKNL